ncbi:hypothetical protein KFU94_62185 [Chloroflexi bacterium TSY]|nr:hypothetical protein [Chloroflexi bacterium TSY]
MLTNIATDTVVAIDLDGSVGDDICSIVEQNEAIVEAVEPPTATPTPTSTQQPLQPIRIHPRVSNSDQYSNQHTNQHPDSDEHKGAGGEIAAPGPVDANCYRYRYSYTNGYAYSRANSHPNQYLNTRHTT